MKLLSALHQGLLRLEDALLLCLVAALIGVPVLQIISRLMEWQGFLWADQAVRLGVLWLALVGAMIATRQQRHIRIDILEHFANPLLNSVLSRLANGVTAIICGLIAWYSIGLVRADYEYGDIAFLDLPLWFCELIIPFAFSIMALRFAAATVLNSNNADTQTPSSPVSVAAP